MGIELPTDIQQTLDASDPRFAGAQNGPVIPGTQMPVAPSQQQTAPQAPDIDDDKSVTDRVADAFLAHLASSLKKNNPVTPQPQNPTQNPGSFSDKMSRAVSGIGASLGDAAHAGDPGATGFLSGITRTLSAREAREAREHQQAFENDRQQKNDEINAAIANANLRQHTVSIYQQEKGLRDSAASSGAAFINHLRDGGFHVDDNISQDQLNAMVKKNPDYLTTHTGRITGYEPVYDSNGQQKVDANGNPVESPVWSLADIASGDLSKQTTVTPALSKKWADAGVGNYPAGTVLPVTSANRLDVQSERVQTTLGILDSARLQKIPNEVKDQIISTLQDAEVQHAVAMYPGNALGGLYSAQKNVGDHLKVAQQQLSAAQQKSNQQATAAAQQQIQKLQDISGNLDKAINLGFSDADREKFAKDEQKAREDAEKERHAREEEAIQNRRADVQAQKETQQKGLGDSYKTENKEFDTIRKPLATSLDAFSTLRNSLDQGTAAGDSVVAPALLKALVAGGGVRITQAEINNFTHGRSSLEDMKGVLQKMTNGKSITPVQRQQVYALLGAVESKVRAKNDILNDAQDQLDNAQTVADQRKAVSDARRKLDAVDSGQFPNNPAQSGQSSDPFSQFGGKAH